MSELSHFGVRGMKWGHRKEYQQSTRRRATSTSFSESITTATTIKFKDGSTLSMSKDKTPAIAQMLYRAGIKSIGNSANFTIRSKDGSKVGEASISKINNEELNLMWLQINKKHRGQGYGTAMMKLATEFGKSRGFKKLTLEVPGASPDARHIYEKLGFKVDPTAPPPDKNDAWGGLTSMVYRF